MAKKQIKKDNSNSDLSTVSETISLILPAIKKRNRNSKPSRKKKKNRNSKRSQKYKKNRNSKPSKVKCNNGNSKPSKQNKNNLYTKPSAKKRHKGVCNKFNAKSTISSSELKCSNFYSPVEEELESSKVHDFLEDRFHYK